MLAAINPIPGTHMNPQLGDAFANRFAIAHVACFDLTQTNTHTGLSNFVPQRFGQSVNGSEPSSRQ